jgi:hypothetical protein
MTAPGVDLQALSISSRRALLWAGALARYRAEQRGDDPGSAAADAFDLLVGMLLEHPEDAEPRLLLAHFHLVPGQLLPFDYPRPPPEAIAGHMRALSPDQAPLLQPDAQWIVQTGTELGLRTGSPEVAELRALFAAMLQATTPLQTALIDLLAERNADLGEIARATVDYLSEHDKGEGYAKFLVRRFPFALHPVDIPNYKADHGQRVALDDDRVGIRAEVDAFAYLLASRGLKPPLAVGLFGDWGSGKSFFMEAVRRRIEQLTREPQVLERPQADVPFWKRIIQIEFNAWHYVEGELWASLVDHIFNELKFDENETEDLVEQRRRHWLEQLDFTRVRLAQLESERGEAERNLRDKEQQAESLRRQRDSELANLERLRSQVTTEIVVKESLGEVRTALEPFLITVGVPTAAAVFGKLDEARAELKRGRLLIDTLCRDDAQRRWVIGCLIGVPALVWLLSRLDFDAVEAAFGGLSAALAATLTLLNKATAMMRARLQVLESAERRVNAEVAAEREALQARISASEKGIGDAEVRLKEVVDTQMALARDLDEIQRKLKEVTPARVITDFVAERVGSGDYHKHLGIPALIQKDFRQLAQLVAKQNEEILSGETAPLANDDVCFNRIILYIDDLDRCPDERVVEVLQAVHLLLAFELFVVVVAVDSRWLSHALTRHFEALVVEGARGRGATPDDYLEKIFQIAFWVQPLGEAAKRNIIQSLLRGHVVGVAGAGGEDTGGDKPTVGKAQLEVFKTLDPASAPPTLQAAALSITADELRFLDTLATLLGSTPRSTKRFVNLYQLVRIIYRLAPGAAIPPALPEHALLAFVLALGEGLPELGSMVLEEAAKAGPADTFEILIGRARARADDAQVRRLDNWLASRPEWKQIPAERMAKAFRKVDRFLFRIGASHHPSKPRPGRVGRVLRRARGAGDETV